MLQKLVAGLILGFFGAILGIFIGAVLGLFVAFVLQFVFNHLVAGWAGLPEMSYWQAYGISWVCGMLFKSSNVTTTNS